MLLRYRAAVLWQCAKFLTALIFLLQLIPSHVNLRAVLNSQKALNTQ